MSHTLPSRNPVMALSLAVLVLSGCGFGQSRLNPFNWFGRGEEVVVEEGEVNPLLPRRTGGLLTRPEAVYQGVPVDQITDLRIERTRSGAIILVEGLAARQGPYEVQLTPANEEDEPVDGVLSYTFDVVYPSYNTVVGPERTRKVTVARSLETAELEGVRIIRVIGERNSRESRRR